ncbi:hypothetical protein HCN51_49050 [Nonomuraea sp. FMUSA5-5]|uniref:Uncharacterized protein n=1 Tax=Nonomuraea composti TaxID=2720023 RepID=A0ABX1BNA4_9ACTN|nr:hypothetical protein [Nonomuraea sp. FMUSA5-5]NJP97291.1 hypothetical protein [Nonomuraea sp. FMUSA5-5]
MKRTLIAAGGALATAAALMVLAAPASAVPAYCNLSLADASRSLGIDTWGVYAGQREADACESDHGMAHDKWENEKDKYDNGNWDNGGGWDNGSWGNGGNWNNGGNWGHGGHGYTTNWASPGNWGNRGYGLPGASGSRGYGWPTSAYRF